MTGETLVPCPWCGAVPRARGGTLWPWGLECSCGAMGPRGSRNAEDGATIWNGNRDQERKVIKAAKAYHAIWKPDCKDEDDLHVAFCNMMESIEELNKTEKE